MGKRQHGNGGHHYRCQQSYRHPESVESGELPSRQFFGAFAVVLLPNGNYVFWAATGSPPDAPDSGLSTATWFDGANGATLDGQNTLDAQNTLYGHGGGFMAQAVSSGSSFFASFSSILYPAVVAGFTDPNELSYALGEGQTITVAPSFLTRTLDAGTDVIVQANDDITVDSPITAVPTKKPGNLTLETGRSILINASINTAGANLSLIADDTVADGVINSERDPGDADITMKSGTTLDTGSGSLTVNLKQSTDKANNGRGSVTLLGVTAAAFTLPADTTLGVAINGTTPGDGVTAGTYSQLNVSGSIDLNDATLHVTTSIAVSAGATFTIVKSGGGVSGTFNGLTEGSLVVAADGSEFTISYRADGGKAVVLTARGIKSTPPAVTGVSPAAGPTTGGTLVTITGTNLAGTTVVEFGNAKVNRFIIDTATQITVMSPAGTGAVDVVVETAGGQSPLSPNDKFTYFRSSANLSAVAASGNYGGTATISAALTAGGTPLAGKPVTFTLKKDGTSAIVGTATTDANGTAILTGVSLAGLNAGAYPGAVGASFGGDSTHAGVSASGTLVVGAAPLVIRQEQPIFLRKTNKKGKPIGRPVLSGFLFDFSGAARSFERDEQRQLRS